jgi:hypothetical protein
MSNNELFIRFEDVTGAEAGVEAQRLQEVLLDSAPDINVRLKRERSDTMDMGATLVLLLGTPAVIAVAKGIAAYVKQRGSRPGKVAIEQRNADGTSRVVVIDADSADIAKIAEALRPQGVTSNQA